MEMELEPLIMRMDAEKSAMYAMAAAEARRREDEKTAEKIRKLEEAVAQLQAAAAEKNLHWEQLKREQQATEALRSSSPSSEVPLQKERNI